MANQGKPFADKEIEYIRANYHSMDVGDIADNLGRTRNSVLGRAYRMGLCETTGKQRTSCNERAARIVERRQQIVLKVPIQMMKDPADDERVVAGTSADDADVDERFAGKLLITDLKPNGCKWPVEEIERKHFFCGAPRILGCPYCPEHAAGAYNGTWSPQRWSDRRKRYR